MRLRWLAGLLCFVAALPAGVPAAQAPAARKSFLWKVQKGAAVLYLAGSVHALDQSVYPLSPAFQRAFESSGALVEEIDLADSSSLAAAPLLLGKGMFQDGRTFDQVVSKDTATLVAERLKGTPLSMELIRPMKPWMVDMMLTALDVQQAGLDVSFGLDKYFFERATETGKDIIPLETAESQVDRLDQMPLAVQEQMLRSSLNGLASTQAAALTEIVTQWKKRRRRVARADAALRIRRLPRRVPVAGRRAQSQLDAAARGVPRPKCSLLCRRGRRPPGRSRRPDSGNAAKGLPRRAAVMHGSGTKVPYL